MSKNLKRQLFICFFLSGFCGLLYQVVWLRMAFAAFGIITPVLSVVISVFMLGLFIGSWVSGRYIEVFSNRFKIGPIYLYALAETVIGIGAFTVPILFKFGQSGLLKSGEMDSAGYLSLSAVILSLSLLPWCIAMGATFPTMMAFIRKLAPKEEQSFSFLYLANVIGAMTGVLITALVLIETLGFEKTVWVAAFINFTVAFISICLEHSYPRLKIQEEVTQEKVSTQKLVVLSKTKTNWLFLVLFATGFISMGMEVVWTRAFTPVLRTHVYAFAMLLFVYLLATWVGSLCYRKNLSEGKIIPTARIISWLVISALLPVLLNDPRIVFRSALALISIFPICALLGYLTPKLIDQLSNGNPESAGSAYSVNVLGCILGPLFVSYILLPKLGVLYSLVVLSLPFFFFFVVWFRSQSLSVNFKASVAVVSAVLLVLSSFVLVSYEEHYNDYKKENGVLRRDHSATVISYGTGMRKHLLVNGVGITFLTPITKVMAHLPLASLTHKPESALVICLGMGTTLRSLHSWGIDATAVELVPSVRDAFPYYFSDASEIMKDPKVHIVIDDGRRFLKRTEKKFDVITIDPPPPIEAAGSSLLYSEQFYSLVKAHLTPNGIFQQWFPGGERRIGQAIYKSLENSFRYVRIFRSIDRGNGLHFLASDNPIPNLTTEELIKKLPPQALKDLMEWNSKADPVAYLNRVISSELTSSHIQADNVAINDDKPVNEYFVLRRSLMGTLNEPTL